MKKRFYPNDLISKKKMVDKKWSLAVCEMNWWSGRRTPKLWKQMNRKTNRTNQINFEPESVRPNDLKVEGTHILSHARLYTHIHNTRRDTVAFGCESSFKLSWLHIQAQRMGNGGGGVEKDDGVGWECSFDSRLQGSEAKIGEQIPKKPNHTKMTALRRLIG